MLSHSYVPSFSFKTGRNPAMTVLKTENLEAGYTVPLFKPLSLTVKRGDKIAITGENGAGKSTLIKTRASYAARRLKPRHPDQARFP